MRSSAANDNHVMYDVKMGAAAEATNGAIISGRSANKERSYLNDKTDVRPIAGSCTSPVERARGCTPQCAIHLMIIITILAFCLLQQTPNRKCPPVELFPPPIVIQYNSHPVFSSWRLTVSCMVQLHSPTITHR